MTSYPKSVREVGLVITEIEIASYLKSDCERWPAVSYLVLYQFLACGLGKGFTSLVLSLRPAPILLAPWRSVGPVLFRAKGHRQKRGGRDWVGKSRVVEVCQRVG